jgi:hypothetical protein
MDFPRPFTLSPFHQIPPSPRGGEGEGEGAGRFDDGFSPRLPISASFFKGGLMDSYLVRIYRKAENNPRMLIGVVEEVGANDKKAFNNLYELWDILNPIRKVQTLSKKSKHSKRNNNMG